MNEIERCETCQRFVLREDRVAIPVSEYTELQRLAEAAKRRTTVNLYRGQSRSPIALNPELASFILEASHTMLASKISAACVERFGPDIAPSRSAVFRFLQAMKGAAPG